MTVQFLELGGQKVAVLPIEDYERLLGVVEDKADVVAAANAETRRNAGEEYVPAELVDRLLKGENPLKVWRTYRGMTQQQLAMLSGVGASYISEIENGNRIGKPAIWRKLARSLNVDLDDIVPDDKGQ